MREQWRTLCLLQGARLASHRIPKSDLYCVSNDTPDGVTVATPVAKDESETSFVNIVTSRRPSQVVLTANDKRLQPQHASSNRHKTSSGNIALAENIDRYSRAVFPLIFVALSSLYWVIYLSISPSGAAGDFIFI